MDNATYHHAQRAKQFLYDNGISVLYLPPSSSELNPIEKYWEL